MIVPVILSGGSGTRLWPLSTPQRPKQFLPLVSDRSLFTETLARVEDRSVYAEPIIVANVAHEQLCTAELAARSATLLLEPVARNTAAAIAMAALVAVEQDPQAILLVMPSDHLIPGADQFHRAVAVGREAAQAEKLVTFGIKPTGPETGYGYLEAGDAVAAAEGSFAVVRFTEKPDRATAERMLASGNHFWNGGIFMYAARTFLAECKRLAPEVFACAGAAIAEASRDAGAIRPSRERLQACPDISVDYAVMERSDRIVMVPLDAGWSDVGSWDSLADVSQKGDPASGRMIDCDDCFVRSDGPSVSMIGVEGLIVIAAGDQIVIMRKGRSQDIKRLAASA